MRRNFIWASALAISVMMSSHSHADIVSFVFEDTGAGDTSDGLDPGGTGATMIGSTTGTLNTTLTIVDLLAPEYVDNNDGLGFVATGTILSAAAGDNVLTNINGNADALGINNPSINNGDFDTIGAGTEGNDFNSGESLIFSFDEDVVFQNIEFEAAVTGNILDVIVGGVTLATFDGANAVTTFGNNTVIPADTNITFAASGPLANTDFRIVSFTVDTVVAVPEPSSLLGLMGLAGLFAVKRRRK